MSNKGNTIAKLSFEDRLHVVEFLRATPGLTRTQACEAASKHLGVLVTPTVITSVGKAMKYDFAPTPRSGYRKHNASKDMRTLGRVLNRVVDELGIALTDIQRSDLRRIAHYQPTLAEQQQELDLRTAEAGDNTELRKALDKMYGGEDDHY